MKTTALIEMGKDGTFGIFTPDINHTIIGDGETVAEAKADFENSVEEMMLSYTENGRAIPDELKNIEFEYKYDLASFFNYYDWINVSKFAQAIGMNSTLMRQYKRGATYISERQTKKIETALHKFGNQLADVRL
ncbi:MAG: type II toxin-antitoxin system HicB family antitoxin, partial [Prevotellaceae bacterium]|jgi:predicted RNase H-like HicB family nuclease|nr:type II toxin-antitoxin system HicB family antitoxin [Prevotellaceae bacterium]